MGNNAQITRNHILFSSKPKFILAASHLPFQRADLITGENPDALTAFAQSVAQQRPHPPCRQVSHDRDTEARPKADDGSPSGTNHVRVTKDDAHGSRSRQPAEGGPKDCGGWKREIDAGPTALRHAVPSQKRLTHQSRAGPVFAGHGCAADGVSSTRRSENARSASPVDCEISPAARSCFPHERLSTVTEDDALRGKPDGGGEESELGRACMLHEFGTSRREIMLRRVRLYLRDVQNECK
ncbi:hypothetical protein K3495_g9361 [Podosphaera aphanis]|nr:hypothetical protein K3495_g9361 [Podosphaera aphanis]